jgi:hypothetical protein
MLPGTTELFFRYWAGWKDLNEFWWTLFLYLYFRKVVKKNWEAPDVAFRSGILFFSCVYVLMLMKLKSHVT